MSLRDTLADVEARFATGEHQAHLALLETYREAVHAYASAEERATWYVWMGFLHSMTGSLPDIAILYSRAGRALAHAHGLYAVQAMADCCLAQGYVMTGDYPEGLRAGHRALATFEVVDNVPWACRVLWNLSILANAVGDFKQSRRYCHRAARKGQNIDDARIQGVSAWRLGATRILEGWVQEGLRDCEQALEQMPSLFDRGMALGMQGYGLVKAGDHRRGIRQLRDVIAWSDTAQLLHTRLQFMVHLAASYVITRQPGHARRVGMDLAITSQRAGYAGFEAIGRQRFRASFEAYDSVMYEERDDHVDATAENGPGHND